MYFSSDTIVTDYDINNGTNAYKAIRVAITLDPLHEETSTLLFRPTRIFPHNALIGEGNYYIPGTTNKNQTIITSNADIKFFDNYMVNDSFINGSGNLDTSKALLSLEPNEKRKINIRIWLEGEDQSHCNDLTIGEAVRIKIGFVGYTSE